jgi:hypothetical protein
VFLKEGLTIARSEEGRGHIEWTGRSTLAKGDVVLKADPVGAGFKGRVSLGAGMLSLTSGLSGAAGRLSFDFLYSDSNLGAEVASFGLQKAMVTVGSAETSLYGLLGIRIPEHRLFSGSPFFYTVGFTFFGLGKSADYKLGLGGSLSIPLSTQWLIHPGASFALDRGSSRFEADLEYLLHGSGFWRDASVLVSAEFGRVNLAPYQSGAVSLQTRYW